MRQIYNHDNINDQYKARDEAIGLIKDSSFDWKKNHISNFGTPDKYEKYNLKELTGKVFDILCKENDYHKACRFLESIEEIKPIKRNNRTHDVRCEFAKGNSCDCWCNEEFHGLMGISKYSDGNAQ